MTDKQPASPHHFSKSKSSYNDVHEMLSRSMLEVVRIIRKSDQLHEIARESYKVVKRLMVKSKQQRQRLPLLMVVHNRGFQEEIIETSHEQDIPQMESV